MRNYFRYLTYLAVSTALSLAHAGSFDDFFRAVNVDNAGAVQQLLAQGFDPNTPNEKGQVGLYLALRDDSPKVVAALLADPKTNVDISNGANETPLMMAALRGKTDWAQRLLERGAALNRAGWTPLHYAATGPEPKLVTLLLARGAHIEALSPNLTTPLMMASRYGPEEAVNVLLAAGASPKARNDQGLNAADFARLGGREALAKRLAALAP